MSLRETMAFPCPCGATHVRVPSKRAHPSPFRGPSAGTMLPCGDAIAAKVTRYPLTGRASAGAGGEELFQICYCKALTDPQR